MVPLEQYSNQIGNALWNKLSKSIRSQFETKPWVDLQDKLWDELDKETLIDTLYEELAHQCL